MEMTPAQTAAAMHGLATNKALPPEDRLQCALQALEFYEKQFDREEERAHVAAVSKRVMAENVEIMERLKPADEAPQAWRDLISGLILLSRGQNNEVSPLHCDHDQLTVCADPHRFTRDERVHLKSLGFIVDGHDTDDSDRGSVEECNGEYCDSCFVSFRFGSA